MENSSLIHIVDSHNKVLTAWAAYRSTLDQPPRLISLDHHTDTSRPFRRLIGDVHGKELSESQFNSIQSSHLKTIIFSEPRTVEDSISKLNNDEHIVAAIKSNIISSAYVIAHNAVNTDLQTYKQHSIICHAVSESFLAGRSPKPDHNIVLESSFIEQALAAFDKILTQAQDAPLLSLPYILDIDLDYFNTFKSVIPKNADWFRSLAKNAGLITVATEPEYVKTCAIEAGLTSEYLLEKLLKFLPKSD